MFAPGPRRRDNLESLLQSRQRDVCGYTQCRRGPNGTRAPLHTGDPGEVDGFCCLEHHQAAEREQHPDRFPGTPEAQVQPEAEEREQPEAPRPVAAGPPELDRLLADEQRRSTARRARDTQAADQVLGDIVRDLDDLLTLVEQELQPVGAARVLDTTGLEDLPLGEVAELLDLPGGEADTVLRALADGSGEPADREAALRHVDDLRTRLRQVADAADHRQLDRLLRAVVGIALVVTLADGANVVGDAALEEVLRAGLLALAAAALRATADDGGERRRAFRLQAGTAHRALLDELRGAEGLRGEPAYDGEHAIIRMRVQVRCRAARVASIPLNWGDKQAYWGVLDEITAAVGQQPPPTLSTIRRALRTLTPPAS